MTGPGAERRVFIVDDSRTIQAMLDNAFSSRPGFRVVGFSGDARAAAEMIRTMLPDIVTIDLCMPYLDGAALLAMIGDLTGICKIIVSDTTTTNLLLTSKLVEAGASLCLGKSELIRDPDAFFKKINTAADAVGRHKRPHPSPVRGATDARADRARDIEPASVAAFPVPADEALRLRTLHRKSLANASAERQFDLITRHVARATGFPACLLTFIDRDTQWIKSAYGLEVKSTPRHQAFCNYTISQGGAFVVSDTGADKRFCDNPLVTGAPNIKSYAGHPVVTSDGVRVAALCVIDTRARTVSRQMLDNLADLSDIVAEIVDQRPSIAA